MRFGLALSGGALRGAAHIGVLKALTEHGLYPSWISGTSAGSIIAALYAYGYTPNEIEKIALSINRSIFDPDYSGIAGGILQWLFTRQFNLDGVVAGKRLEFLMKELTENRLINDVKIPIAITAVDINNGMSVIFASNTSGLKNTKNITFIDKVPLCEAVRASISIPVFFRPKIINGMRLVDGGITDNLPLKVLKLMGAKAVIGINLGYSGQRRAEVNNLLEIGNQSLDIMAYQITRLITDETDCVINPNIYDVGMTEVDRIPECIKRGYAVTINNMNMIKKTINS